ncbi:DUF2127 domain-containing protein [Halomicrococcus sp. SG-WS-1]|uniref:DUF2127 domain-containing protein n=1 Tax=Halomicrococcus sp. SG-WS-1 TaxID=3439057 RepID=UPI003F7A8BBB
METSQSSHGADRETAPTGIKVICVLVGLSGLYGLLAGLGLAAMGGAGLVVGAVGVVLSVVQLLVVYGLWTLRSWGWTVTMVVFSLDVLLDVVRLVVGSVSAVLGILVGGIVLWYVYGERDLYR